MSDATAIIAYGVRFALDDDELPPWKQGEVRMAENNWWEKVKGYKPPFELYDSQGEYLEGIEPDQEQIEEYYRCRREWHKQNPMPFIVVLYGGDPMSTIVCSAAMPRWETEWDAIDFDPDDLQIEPDQAFLQFLEEYLPDCGRPKWLLAPAYW